MLTVDLLTVDSAASSLLLQHHMISAIYVPPEVRLQPGS